MTVSDWTACPALDVRRCGVARAHVRGLPALLAQSDARRVAAVPPRAVQTRQS